MEAEGYLCGTKQKGEGVDEESSCEFEKTSVLIYICDGNEEENAAFFTTWERSRKHDQKFRGADMQISRDGRCFSSNLVGNVVDRRAERRTAFEKLLKLQSNKGLHQP